MSVLFCYGRAVSYCSKIGIISESGKAIADINLFLYSYADITLYVNQRDITQRKYLDDISYH